MSFLRSRALRQDSDGSTPRATYLVTWPERYRQLPNSRSGSVRSLAAFTAVGLAALFVATPAHSEILYARPDGDSSSRAYRWGMRLFSTRSHLNRRLTLPRRQTDRERSKSDCSIERGRKRRSTPSTSAASNLPCGGKGPRTRDFSSVDRSKRLGQIGGLSRGLLGGP